MAKLEDKLSKVTLYIPARVTVSQHGYLVYYACMGATGPGELLCQKDQWNRFNMFTYIANGTNAFSGSMRCRDITPCFTGACGPLGGLLETYLPAGDSHYSLEYLWDEAMEALKLGFDPALYNIFSIEAPTFEVVAGDVKVHYGNPNQVAKVTIIRGEGNNLTIGEEELSTKDYFNRIIVDMYTGQLEVRSIFVQGEKVGVQTPSVLCKPPVGYDNRILLPAPLIVTIYLTQKTVEFDFTWKDSDPLAPIDNGKSDPGEEEIESEPETDDPGNNAITVSDYSGGGGGATGTIVNPPIDFDYIYIPESIPVIDMDGVVVGPNIIAGHETGYGLDSESVFITEITQSIKNSDTMTFIEHVKYHEAGLFNIGDKVFGLVYGNTRFRGWIKSKQRIINESEQYIQYDAVGVKGWLSTLPFAANYKTISKSIYWIFNDISQYLPRALVNERLNLTALPASILPLFQLESASFGYALDAIIDYARKYQWYIDHSGILRILDMDNLPVVQLTMPSEGTALTSLHKIISKNLNVDVNNCRTRCIIRGDIPIQEYDELKTVSWDTTGWGGYYGVGTIAIGKRIQPNLLTNSSLPVYVYYKEWSSYLGIWQTFPYSVTFVDCNTGEIKILGQRRDQLYVRYCVKDELNPLKYDSGWRGTAFSDYAVQQVLIQNDTRFRRIIIPEGVIRDDTQYFSSYASNLLASLQDWKIGGSVLVDGLAIDLYIGKSVEILNSGCAELAGKHLAITSITWNFEDNTTSLNLTDDYYLGTGIIDPIDDKNYDERKMIEKVILAKGKMSEFPWVFV
jgi:hypothetical protein